MDPTVVISKQARRELPRWKRLLARRESGLSVLELAKLEDVTPEAIYLVLKRAKQARNKGWL